MQDGCGGNVTNGLTILQDGPVVVLTLSAPKAAPKSPASSPADPLRDPAARGALTMALEAPPPGARVLLLQIMGADPNALPEAGEAGAAAEAALRRLCAAVEGAALPVAVLLDGPVAGPLADLALAARLRLAGPRLRMAFPALSLGRMPSGGSAMRLARLLGAEQALRLWRQGRPVTAAEALSIGLIDRVLDKAGAEELTAAAQAALHPGADPVLDALLAEAATDPLPRQPGLRDGRAYLASIAAARADLAAGAQISSADLALLDSMEAALLLPAAQAADLDAVLCDEVAGSETAAALTHIRRAEMRAAQVPPALAAVPVVATRHLGVSGAEQGLAGLVLTALARGRKVTVADPDRGRLVAFLETVASRQEMAVQEGRLTAGQRDTDWARLVPALEPAALDECELILAAAGAALPDERRGRPVLVAGRGALPAGAFRLMLSGRLAELALPAETPAPAARQALAFLSALGLMVVLTGQQTATGVAVRLSSAGGQALRRLVEIGVPAADVSAAMTGFGLPAPPLPEAPDMPPRPMPATQIVDRWLGALANEGARLLSAGVVSSPLDIDLVAVAGLGFPRHRGGPLHLADQRGLIILRRDLLNWAADGEIWKPVPAWDALVSVGRGFAGAIRTG